MEYNNKDYLRNKSIELYLQGKTMSEIASILKCSRNYVGELIKDDPEVIKFRNNSKVKVFKYKNTNKMRISIPTSFFNKIGITNNLNLNEYVDISLNESTKEITIKKHKE